MAEKIKLGYGAHPLEITPPENLLQLLEPNPMPACPEPTAELERALAEPINAPAPEELYKPGMKVCIVVADKTRIFPKTEMIRTLIRHLPSIPDRDLTIVIGGGNHLYAPPEAHGIDSQLINRYQVLVHQSLPQDDFIEVGKSQRGTPFKLNPAVARADLIFGLGQVKPHYFAGYAGGAKAIVPGVSALETIIKNHLLQADPGAELGRIKDNPFRQDLDEIINFLPNFYIYNLVMNREGELVNRPGAGKNRASGNCLCPTSSFHRHLSDYQAGCSCRKSLSGKRSDYCLRPGSRWTGAGGRNYEYNLANGPPKIPQKEY